MTSLINLLPARRREIIRTRALLRIWTIALPAYCVLLLAICVAARMVLAVPGSADDRELQSARQSARQTEVSLAVAKKDLASLQTRQRMVSTFIDQPDWAAFLRLIGKPLGDSLVLREVKLQQMTANQRGPTASPRSAGASFRLELRGLARSQIDLSSYVKGLEDTGLFDEVNLLRTGREPFLTGTATSFELNCLVLEPGGN
jgi:hypothetical protein